MKSSVTISSMWSMLQKHSVLIIMLIVMFGTTFCNFSEFIDYELKSKWYCLYLMISIFIPLFLLASYKNKMAQQICVSKSLLTLLLLYFFIRIVFGQLSLSNVAFCLLFILLYYLLASIQVGWSFVYISSSVIVVSLFMSLYGIAQYIGLISSRHLFMVVGSFDNPAGYASMLSMSIPFVCYYIYSDKCDKKTPLWFIYFVIVLAITLSASRTGILISIIISVTYIIKRYKINFSNVTLWLKFIMMLLVIAIILGFYIFKKDSTKGRVIIWRCTWEMIKEKPWFGHGYKSFEAKYMLYQADYFEQNKKSDYILLSDNVKHPFNEFILLIVEFGFFAFFLFLLFVIQLILLYRKRQTDESFSLMLSLLAIAIFSFFSYPFQYPHTWLIFFMCVQLILFDNREKQCKIYWPSKFIVVFSSILLFSITVKEMYFENKWYLIEHKRKFGNIQEVIATYETLYPHLKKNAYFLYNYAAKLNYFGYYERSCFLVDKCRNYFNDYDVQMLIADNLFHLEEWNKAKNHYSKAFYMCPNRFVPLNQLHKIAILENDSNMARKIACLIIDKPTKVPSATVYKIKQKMQQYLETDINCIVK